MLISPIILTILVRNIGVSFSTSMILTTIIMMIGIILMVGFGASTAYLIPWSLLPDAIDADPEKPAGIYTAWMVLIQKLGIGLSVQLLGFLLSVTGYRSITQCSRPKFHSPFY